jgi:hypothetical protein
LIPFLFFFFSLYPFFAFGRPFVATTCLCEYNMLVGHHTLTTTISLCAPLRSIIPPCLHDATPPWTLEANLRQTHMWPTHLHL